MSFGKKYREKVTCPNATIYEARLDQHSKDLFDPDGSASPAEIIEQDVSFSPVLSR
jgi:hypothetical protein